MEWSKAVLELHYSQLISVQQFTKQDIKDKSVVGRGVVGLMIAGPLGAVVGGISGVGKKTKNKYYLLIEYWDRETQQPVAISFESKKSFIDIINYYNKTLKQKHLARKVEDAKKKKFAPVYQKTITTKLVRVTHENEDGTNRQELLEDLQADDYLNAFETEFNGEPAYEFRDIYDNIVGYLNKQLTGSINSVYGPGVYLEVKDFEITGGGDKHFGCNVTLDIFTMEEQKEDKDTVETSEAQEPESEKTPEIQKTNVKEIETKKTTPLYEKPWVYIVCFIVVFIIIMAVINIPGTKDYTYKGLSFKISNKWKIDDSDAEQLKLEYQGNSPTSIHIENMDSSLASILTDIDETVADDGNYDVTKTEELIDGTPSTKYIYEQLTSTKIYIYCDENNVYLIDFYSAGSQEAESEFNTFLNSIKINI